MAVVVDGLENQKCTDGHDCGIVIYKSMLGVAVNYQHPPAGCEGIFVEEV
jgi:hypothetical protein